MQLAAYLPLPVIGIGRNIVVYSVFLLWSWPCENGFIYVRQLGVAYVHVDLFQLYHRGDYEGMERGKEIDLCFIGIGINNSCNIIYNNGLWKLYWRRTGLQAFWRLIVFIGLPI